MVPDSGLGLQSGWLWLIINIPSSTVMNIPQYQILFSNTLDSGISTPGTRSYRFGTQICRQMKNIIGKSKLNSHLWDLRGKKITLKSLYWLSPAPAVLCFYDPPTPFPLINANHCFSHYTTSNIDPYMQ